MAWCDVRDGVYFKQEVATDFTLLEAKNTNKPWMEKVIPHY